MTSENKKSILKSARIRIICIGLILGLVFACFSSYLTYQYMEKTRDQRLLSLRQVVLIAKNSIEPILIEYRNQNISMENALKQVRNLIRSMVYTDYIGKNYIFMSSYDGVMLVQPFETKKEMTDVWDLKDSHGVFIIRALVKVAQSKQGQGYVSYHYQRPGQTSAQEKISFVIGLPELGCYIGTGQYMADLRKDQLVYIMKIAGLTFVLLIFLYFLVRASMNEIRAQNTMLHRAERQLQAIFDNTFQFIGTLSPEGELTKANRSSLKLIEKSEADVIGMPFWKTPWWIDDESENLLRKAILDSSKGKFCRFETTHKSKKQKTIFVDFNLSPIFDANGSVVSLLAEGRDVSEQTKAREELKRAKNYISKIIESMPASVVAVDIGNNVTQWNSKAEYITGVPEKNAIGKPLKTVLPQMENKLDTISEAINTKEIKRYHKETRRLNDLFLYENITIYPIEADGVKSAVIMIEDVTEKVRMEEMMIQSEKMISVGGFAAGMAHEINNPLAGVLQNADVLENRLMDKTLPANIKMAGSLGISLEKIDEYLELRGIPRMVKAIKESSRRMASIVENMLSFARKSDSLFSSHDSATMMENILVIASTDYDLKKRFDFKSIIIEKDFDRDLPMIPCSGSEIQQVVLNILKNGAHAMSEKQSFSNEYQPKFFLKLSKEKKTNMLRIEIRDNGPGIDDATCKRIFDPFFTTKPVGVGTGLGLSVSYFIITENHNGKIEVESELGKGAKFIIRLPLERKNSITPK